MTDFAVALACRATLPVVARSVGGGEKSKYG